MRGANRLFHTSYVHMAVRLRMMSTKGQTPMFDVVGRVPPRGANDEIGNSAASVELPLADVARGASNIRRLWLRPEPRGAPCGRNGHETQHLFERTGVL